MHVIRYYFMAAALESYADKKIAVITGDGRVITGRLKAHDQVINLVLVNTIERVYSHNVGVEEVALGLYVIRGDNVALIGEIDVDVDNAIDLTYIHAEPLEIFKT